MFPSRKKINPEDNPKLRCQVLQAHSSQELGDIIKHGPSLEEGPGATVSGHLEVINLLHGLLQ